MPLTKGKSNGLLITAGVIFTAIAGFGIYVGRQFYLLYDAPYKVVGAKIYSIDNARVKITLYIGLLNKGNVSLSVTEQEYNIFINGIFVSNIKSGSAFIKANGETLLPLNIDVDTSKLISSVTQNLLTLLTDKSKLNIAVRGKLSVRANVAGIKGIIKLKDYPISFDYTLAEIIALSKQPPSPTT